MAKEITFDGLVAEYGKYTKDGVEYAIQQNPYFDYVAGSSTAYVVHGETYYFASGYDREGNSVRLIWEITNKETEDESDACDWDVFEAQPNYGDPAPWRALEFKERQYQLVPIQNMRFDDLSDAQTMIEQAAVLQQKGVGI